MLHKITPHQGPDYLSGKFQAMAGPCEVLIDSNESQLAALVLDIVQQEASRIERKFSRYRNNNIIHMINQAGGKPIQVDNETADLLDFAARCFDLSDGLFDITSGVLRKVWRFDGSSIIPDSNDINALLEKLGWEKVRWQRPELTLLPGMEIDLGGIAKEYAVDKTIQRIQQLTNVGCLVNFGGDIAVSAARQYNQPWIVAVADPNKDLQQGAQRPYLTLPYLELSSGAVATSGDAHRYIMQNGVRYGHILNPKTGWPVPNGPRCVTVAAHNCTEAGMFSTLALLQGTNAEDFLIAQQLKYWCEW